MPELSRRVHHLPFIQAVAASADGSNEAALARAGLLLLRLVDAWAEDPDVVHSRRERHVAATREAVRCVPVGSPVGVVLARIMDTMLAHDVQAAPAVWSRLMAYGRALDLDAQWGLAVDLYDTVLSHLDLEDDSESVVNAYLRRGSCLIELGRFADADLSYELASDRALRSNDTRGALRARIGESKLAMLRGNLPKAAEILDDTIQRAEAHSLRDVYSFAIHNRASIAFMRGQFEDGIRLAFRALRDSPTESERDRILNDLAAGFHLLGMRSTARDVFLILEATACEQFQRWVSGINLMELEAESGSKVTFERYKLELSEALPSGQLRVEFELQVGRAYQWFGEFDLAREWLERSVNGATEHSMNRVLSEAQGALAANTAAALRRPAGMRGSIPSDVEAIAHELRAMRELALTASDSR